jgi:ribonuclease HII
MLLLGVDEAGKGPVVGSMFVAGFVVEEEKLYDLAALGVKDSKMLAPARREILEKKLIALAKSYYVLEVPAQVIDELRQVMTMNDLMVRSFSQVLSKLSAHKAILDAADVDAERFGRRVKESTGTAMEILAEHNADKNHQVVSAASILAKVQRDRSVRKLEASLGCQIGSGYPTDPKTLEFLESWIKYHGDLPPCVRRSWVTAQRIKASFI